MVNFLSGDIDFASISGEETGDDWDNLVIYKNKDGSIGMYCWTEVLGRCYDLKDYGKTWTEHKDLPNENAETDTHWPRFNDILDNVGRLFNSYTARNPLTGESTSTDRT